MLPAGPKLYVGLCETDVEPHYLVVGSVLFLFLAKPASFADFAHEFEQLLQNLPESSGWLAQDDSWSRLNRPFYQCGGWS